MSDSQSPQDMRIIPTTRPAKAVFDWFTQAFKLFSAFKLQWAGFTLIVYACFFVLAMIPFVGELLINLILPGMFLVAASVQNNQAFIPARIFEGIKFHLKPLLHLFLINFGAALLASSLAILVVGENAMTSGDPAKVLSFMGTMLVIYLPFMMGLAFAPALIVIDKLTAIDAFKMSFKGCFKNAISLTMFSVILIFAFVIAMIPMGLGLLIMLPVMHCILFVMYQDIFRHKARFSISDYPDDQSGNDSDQDGSFMV